MSTVQEIFTTDLTNTTAHPILSRLHELSFDGESSKIVGSIAFDYGFATNSCVYDTIETTWHQQTGYKRVFPFGGTKAVLTYNLKKKLIVATDCRPYNSSDTNTLKLCARIGLIKTVSSVWLYEGAYSFGSGYNISNDSNISAFFNEYVGENPRRDANGLVSLHSDFAITDGSLSITSGRHYRLTGGGVYLADGDISDCIADVGKIIADPTGNNYICCGCRLWMDYD